MASATYFQSRFAASPYILSHFQALILVITTLANLGYLWYLSRQQSTANYPKRIAASLLINCFVFTLLAVSTVTLQVKAEPYLAFILACAFVASLSTGLSQNGVFAFVNRFGGKCTQAVMTGQAVAGVLPAMAQILIVLAVPANDNDSKPDQSTSACVYFITATLVSGACLLMFVGLLSGHGIAFNAALTDAPKPPRRTVGLLVLLGKLRWFSFAIWAAFSVTMAFPVFTQAIVSVQPEESGRFYKPDVFIPLGFLIWNIGDLMGRMCCGWSMFTTHNSKLLAVAAVGRLAFIPLYYACNIKGEGALVGSDLFYWALQLAFGVSNGWIGSNCMMAAPDFVAEDEQEACGGFMGLCLVVGLATGSMVSFLAFSF